MSDSVPCPVCGGEEWRAHYMEPQSQVVTVAGEPGHLQVVDYEGSTESYDSEADETVECQGCGYTERFGTMDWQPVEPAEIETTCPTCRGGGEGDEPCAVCSGRGTIVGQWAVCPDCNGVALRPEPFQGTATCARCAGTGRVIVQTVRGVPDVVVDLDPAPVLARRLLGGDGGESIDSGVAVELARRVLADAKIATAECETCVCTKPADDLEGGRCGRCREVFADEVAS